MLESGWEPPTWDRWGGTALGAACGAGVVLFSAWVANATGSLHGLTAGPAPTVSPQELAASLSERVGPLVRVAEALSNDPEIRAVLDDEDFRDALARGDLASLAAEGRLDRVLRLFTVELERRR